LYQNYVPIGTSVTTKYLLKVMPVFLKQFRHKRPNTVNKKWWFHWDNASSHTATAMTDWLAKHNFCMVPHPPYSPDLAPADFFLFPKAKSMLSGTRITSNSVKSDWERICRTISTSDFTEAYDKWLDRWNKCIAVGGGYVEKSE